MPRYQVTAPDGRVVTVEGDAPPTDADLDGIFASLPAKAEESTPGAAALSKTEGISEQPWYTKNMGGLPSVTQALSAIPGIGGLVGGILGGSGGTVLGTPVGGMAGGMAGAAVGGAGGEAVRQLAFRALSGGGKANPGESAMNIGKEGATQAVLEGGGRVVSGLAKALGRGMVEQAVRPTITLQGEFPNVIDTIIKERLPVGARPFGKRKGSEMAAERLGEESRAVRKILADAGQSGQTFDPAQITAKPLGKLSTELGKAEAQNPGGTVKLQALVDNFLAQNSQPMSPLAVQEMKQTAGKIAKPILKARARGENVGVEQGVLAQFNEALRQGGKDAMETIPGIAEGEAKKQSLIGARAALRRAEERRLSLMAESASGIAGALGGALSPGGGLDDKTRNAVLMWGLTRGLLHPRQMSRAGLALTNEQANAILRQFPRLAETLISASQAQAE